MAQQLRWAQELQGVLCKSGSLLDRPVYPSNCQSLTSLLPTLFSLSTLFTALRVLDGSLLRDSCGMYDTRVCRGHEHSICKRSHDPIYGVMNPFALLDSVLLKE